MSHEVEFVTVVLDEALAHRAVLQGKISYLDWGETRVGELAYPKTKSSTANMVRVRGPTLEGNCFNGRARFIARCTRGVALRNERNGAA